MAGRLEDVVLRGLRVDQPLATLVSPGTLYFVTDENVIERSNGLAWQSYSGAGGGGTNFVNPSIYPFFPEAEEPVEGFPIPGPAGPAGGGGITQLTGDVTAGPASGSTVATIGANKVVTSKILDANVTYAKIQDISAASKLLGRGSASGSGVAEEITLGINLSMSGTTINAASGSSGWALISSITASAASHDFTGLAAYTEILVIGSALTVTGSCVIQMLVSIDNGLNYLNSSGDYLSVDTTGVAANDTTLSCTSNSSSTRYISRNIEPFNSALPKRSSMWNNVSSNSSYIIPTLNALNAIRVRCSSNSFSGGTISVFGR